MAQPPVLKNRHSLLKHRLLPVVLKLQALSEDDMPVTGLVMGRLKKDHPIENYTLHELGKEFYNLTGEVAIDVLRLAGRCIYFNIVKLILVKFTGSVTSTMYNLLT